ncbi:sterol desaturase family protein [Streptomyces erythrochromogenes]|uniref:sterol desaturase family protein n=1 Tax=Streptomyces erythrochromogenes TaxID=285574 RepID=UPI003698E2A2
MRRITRIFVRHCYVPILLVGVNATAVALMAHDRSKAWLLALLLVAMALSFAAARVLPYRLPWNADRGDTRRDLAHTVVNEGLVFASLATIPALAERLVLAQLWPVHWPFSFQVLTAVLLADLGITLTHCAGHHVDVLWRFHAVHHSVKRYYGLDGLVKHPLHQAVETTSRHRSPPRSPSPSRCNCCSSTPTPTTTWARSSTSSH